MDPFLEAWLACPRCGAELTDRTDSGLQCLSCGAAFGRHDGVLDLVDPEQKVSSEGPGDTPAMAWRRRRWDVLRGPEAPENAAYLAAIWERLRPDDTVVDLGCGPGSLLAWMADFAPEISIIGLDLSFAALDEARRAAGSHANVRFVRASTRRRLPLHDGSCDVVLRRLAPGLPDEIVRVLAPGGHYLRFTFAANHWREVYDLLPGMPRARDETLQSEIDRLKEAGLEVGEPLRVAGTEEVTRPAVTLALRSNPAAFHAGPGVFDAIAPLWRRGDERQQRARLTTELMILVARRPADAVVARPAPPRAARTIAPTAGTSIPETAVRSDNGAPRTKTAQRKAARAAKAAAAAAVDTSSSIASPSSQAQQVEAAAPVAPTPDAGAATAKARKRTKPGVAAATPGPATGTPEATAPKSHKRSASNAAAPDPEPVPLAEATAPEPERPSRARKPAASLEPVREASAITAIETPPKARPRKAAAASSIAPKPPTRKRAATPAAAPPHAETAPPHAETAPPTTAPRRRATKAADTT